MVFSFKDAPYRTLPSVKAQNKKAHWISFKPRERYPVGHGIDLVLYTQRCMMDQRKIAKLRISLLIRQLLSYLQPLLLFVFFVLLLTGSSLRPQDHR